MPRIPDLQGPGPMAIPQIGPQVDPIYLAMSAATMHEMGRLIEPDLPAEVIEPEAEAK